MIIQFKRIEEYERFVKGLDILNIIGGRVPTLNKKFKSTLVVPTHPETIAFMEGFKAIMPKADTIKVTF